MQLVNHLLRGHSDSTDEQGSFLFDDDVDELRELAFRVVTVSLASGAADFCSAPREERGSARSEGIGRGAEAKGEEWRIEWSEVEERDGNEERKHVRGIKRSTPKGADLSFNPSLSSWI